MSDSDECGGGIAELGGSREHKEGGRCSNNATDAKEEDAPGNQEVVEIDQDEKEETPLPNKALEVCHIHDNSDGVHHQ